jgi:GT2 family glycosyltransferase
MLELCAKVLGPMDRRREKSDVELRNGVMANSPSISIVVLNWNGLADTLTCLESLRRLRYRNHRVVVVDNGSTDGSLATLRGMAALPDIQLVESRANLGYAGGNNLGIRRALQHDVEFVLVLNNDTIVDPELLDHLVAAAETHPAAGCFGPWILYMNDPERVWFTRSEWSTEKLAFTAPGKGELASDLSRDEADTEYVCGAAMFFRSSVARQIGLFDERFFLVYEDSDWCWRARKAGFGCLSVPTARVWHKVASSFDTEASPLRTYFSTRNRLLWAEKNASRSEWWRLLRRTLATLQPGVRLERAAAGSTAKATLWAIDAYAREWSRRTHDPQAIAQRRGAMDYVRRRFGDCPATIRTLARTWGDTVSRGEIGARSEGS